MSRFRAAESDNLSSPDVNFEDLTRQTLTDEALSENLRAVSVCREETRDSHVPGSVTALDRLSALSPADNRLKLPSLFIEDPAGVKGEIKPLPKPEDEADKPDQKHQAGERNLSVGCKLTVDQSGDKSVQRKDGTAAKAAYENGSLSSLSETDATGHKVSWKKQGEEWISDQEPPGKRKSLALDDNGNLSYVQESGERKIVRGNGQTLTPGKAEYSFDKEGRIDAIKYADGKAVDRITYKDGTNEISSIQINDDKAGVTRTYTRSGDSLTWNITDQSGRELGTWQGQVAVSENGTYSLRETNSKGEPNGMWHTWSPEGAHRQEYFSDNGSHAVFDDKGKLETVERKDGSKLEHGKENDAETIIQTDAKGKKIVWKKNGEIWRSDSPDSADERKNLRFNKNGEVLFTSADGKRHIQKPDGSEEVREPGKTGVFDSIDVEEARERLLASAEGAGSNGARLTDLMDNFERRCKEAGENGTKAPGEEQIAKAYDNLTEMMQKDGQSFLDSRAKGSVLESGLHNLAFPKGIDQGMNPTCNITTGEIFTAARNPEAYTDLLKQVALTGNYTAPDGKQVQPPRHGLMPGQEEASFSLDNADRSSARNYASKLFQITAINMYIPGYSSGMPWMTQDRIVGAVKHITGEDMPYFNYGERPNGDQLMRLKQDGNFPVGVWTLGGAHVQTIHDVRRGADGNVQVLLDDQHGEYADAGWVSLGQLYSRQGFGGRWG